MTKRSKDILIRCAWCGCSGRKDKDILMTCVGIGAYVDLCPNCRRRHESEHGN